MLKQTSFGPESKLEALDRATGRRLARAAGLSVLVNLLMWRLVASIAGSPPPLPPEIEVTRIVVNARGVRTPKVMSHKQIAHRVAALHREIRRRANLPRPVQRPVPQPRQAPRLASAPPRPVSQTASPPPSGHMLLTAPAVRGAAPSEPAVTQGAGGATGTEAGPQTPPSEAPTPSAPPPPAPAPAAPEPSGPVSSGPPAPPTGPPSLPKPEPTPPPTPVPTPPPTPRPTPPSPPPPPKPKGPTRDAEPTRQFDVEIPDELKETEFKKSVRVRVEIDADGNATPSLRNSSGNTQIDALVLSALRRWRWKPALEDGQPKASTQYFRYDIEVK